MVDEEGHILWPMKEKITSNTEGREPTVTLDKYKTLDQKSALQGAHRN